MAERAIHIALLGANARAFLGWGLLTDRWVGQHTRWVVENALELTTLLFSLVTPDPLREVPLARYLARHPALEVIFVTLTPSHPQGVELVLLTESIFALPQSLGIFRCFQLHFPDCTQFRIFSDPLRGVGGGSPTD